MLKKVSRLGGRATLRLSASPRLDTLRAGSQRWLASLALAPCTLHQRTFSTTASVRQELMDRDNVWRSPYPDVHIPDDVNVAHHVLNNFGKYGNRIAFVDGVTRQEMTYGQLQTNVTRVASALVKQGFKKGDILTVFSPNCPEFGILYMAILAVGGIPSAVNHTYKPDELAHALTHSGAKIVATVPELLATTKEALSSCPDVTLVIIFGEGEGCRPFANLLADDGSAFPENLDIDPKTHIAALLYSSGTTGLPKAVMLSHYNWIASLQQCVYKDVLAYKMDDIFLLLLPMFHIYGVLMIMLQGLYSGSKLVTFPKFEPEAFLQAVQEYKATFLHLVPPIVLFMARHPMVAKYDLSSARSILCGAAPASPDVINELKNKMSPDLLFKQGFGMSEAGVTNICPSDPDKIRSETIGPMVPNMKEKIIDLETGKTLGPREAGELVIKGPNVMMGYLKNEQASKDTLSEDGWMRTGDIGYMDTDGNLVITDRLKELIKYQAFQVAPAELEHLLLTHPAVQDAAVIGLPDDRAGELPRAYVVLKPNQSASQEDIQNYVKEKAASYKQLRGGVEFRAEIPKSTSGKILRRVLKDELLHQKRK